MTPKPLTTHPLQPMTQCPECGAEERPYPPDCCNHCDGCGWYEGGPTLQTKCEQCNGTGVVPAVTDVLQLWKCGSRCLKSDGTFHQSDRCLIASQKKKLEVARVALTECERLADVSEPMPREYKIKQVAAEALNQIGAE